MNDSDGSLDSVGSLWFQRQCSEIMILRPSAKHSLTLHAVARCRWVRDRYQKHVRDCGFSLMDFAGAPKTRTGEFSPLVPVAYQAHSLVTLMVIPSIYTLHCVPSRSIASKCLVRSPLVCNRLLAVIHLFVSIHYSTKPLPKTASIRQGGE